MARVYFVPSSKPIVPCGALHFLLHTHEDIVSLVTHDNGRRLKVQLDLLFVKLSAAVIFSVAQDDTSDLFSVALSKNSSPFDCFQLVDL